MARRMQSPEPVGFWRTEAEPLTVAQLLGDDFCNPDRAPKVPARKRSTTVARAELEPTARELLGMEAADPKWSGGVPEDRLVKIHRPATSRHA